MSKSKKVRRTPPSGRRWTQWKEPEAREVLASWRRSGLSAAAFCTREGCTTARLRYWAERLPDRAPNLELITSEVDPDLAEVKRFMKARIAEGAIAAVVAAVLALLARMCDLNTELQRRIEASRRKRPPSETLHRLQMELPF